MKVLKKMKIVLQNDMYYNNKYIIKYIQKNRFACRGNQEMIHMYF